MLDEARWRVIASGLALVRNVRRRGMTTGRTTSKEREALGKVAAHPAFDDLGPAAANHSPDERGRWIVARIRQRLLELEAGCGRSAPDRAIRCWARYIDEALTPVELYGTHPELLRHYEPARTDIAKRTRVQALMWGGGARGDKDSLPGVLRLGAELRAALSTGLPEGTRLDPVAFSYEWDLLGKARPGAIDLLQVLARLAPDTPFSAALLRESGDCLPGLAEQVCTSPAELRTTLAALRDRGLLETSGDVVEVPALIAGHVINMIPPDRNVHLVAAVVRFLTYALRPDTHDATSWAEWQTAYQHVLAVCDTAQQLDIQLADVAYLFDRASVYVREAIEDADQATRLAERAAGLAAEVGDCRLVSDSLGNLALAHLAAGRKAAAVQASTASHQHTREVYSDDTIEFAESLNVHANVLDLVDRRVEGGEAHARAVEVARGVYTKFPTDSVRGIFLETLNDFANHLLTSGSIPAGRAALEEANRLLRRGEYGWTQVTLNIAHVCREEGDLVRARRELELLRGYLEQAPSAQAGTLIAVLRELSEVYAELGNQSAAAAALREAHRIDNAAGVSLARPSREGRTS